MENISRTPKEALDAAITLLGGVTAAVERLPKVKSYQVIQQWRRAGIPVERCIDIERATNGAVRCEELHPDVDWAYIRNTTQPEAFTQKAA